MSRLSTGARLAFAAFFVWAVVEAVGAVFLVPTWSTPTGDVDSASSAVIGIVAAAVFAGVGLLLAAKRPRNAIGWVFLVVAINLALGLVLARYALDATVTHPGSLPAGIVAAAIYQAGWVILIFGIVLLLLLFPHGRLPSPRWWPVVALAGAGAVTTWVGYTTRSGSLDSPFAAHDNPFGVEALRQVDRLLREGWILMFAAGVAGGFSLVLRFRRARGVERQQYMLFTVAAVAFPVFSVGVNAFESAVSVHSGSMHQVDNVLNAITALLALLLPVSVAVAVLRYRLYEIDRLVSRTLVYVSLTAVLGATYVGLVLAGQALFSSFAGGSNLAIAASTLIVAALFLPLRSRVQGFVDRRFYRRRYDAQQTLEAFGTRLREQVDLETLQGELRGVVKETMQPTHVGVWRRAVEP